MFQPDASPKPDDPTGTIHMDTLFNHCSDWEKAFDLLPNPVFFVDNAGRIAWANQALLAARGVALPDLVGRKCDLFMDFKDSFCEQCALVAEKKTASFFNRQVHVDALSGWFDVAIQAVGDTLSGFQGVMVSAFNVTQSMKVEEAFFRAEEQYRSIFDNSVEGIFQTSASGSIIRANKAFAAILGYGSMQDLRANVRNISQIYVRPIQRDRLLELLARKGQVKHFTLRVYKPDGSFTWVSLSARGVSQDGELQYIEGNMRDISQLVRARRRLRESENFMRAVMNGIRAAIFVINPRTDEIVESNDEAKRLIGQPGKSLHSQKFSDIVTLKTDEAHLSSTDGLNIEATLTRKDGAIVPIFRNTLGLSFRGYIHRVEILFDITERKALERSLLHAQKLESIGQLAAGIAHEINTPMQYVDGNLQFLKTVFETYVRLLANHSEHDADETLAFYREETPKALEQAQEGVERVTTIVKAMKRFSHPGTEEKIPMDINKAVENTVTIARNEWKYTAEVQMDLDPDLPPVPCYPGDFNQALLNVLVNAAHAVQAAVHEGDNKGTIKISTRMTGPFARITIADSGIGIPEKSRSRIFDPFFTTKDPGKGTGQGLAITYSIIKKHHGTIDFDSEEGQGTTFRIYLPMQEAS